MTKLNYKLGLLIIALLVTTNGATAYFINHQKGSATANLTQRTSATFNSVEVATKQLPRYANQFVNVRGTIVLLGQNRYALLGTGKPPQLLALDFSKTSLKPEHYASTASTQPHKLNAFVITGKVIWTGETGPYALQVASIK